MFWPAISVSIAAAWAGCAVLSAAVKVKMLVSAGVVRSASMSTSHIGLKPSATPSLVSATPSYMSQSSDHTDDSLHQQPKLPLGVPGGFCAGLVSTLNVLETSWGVAPFMMTKESRAIGSLSTMAANA
jgi:hypothetical protein